jgi:hypothetical protein
MSGQAGRETVTTRRRLLVGAAVTARATPPMAIATINQGSRFRLVGLRDHPVAPAGLYTNRFIDETLKGVR